MLKRKLTAIIALVLMLVAQASLTAESKSRKEIDKFLKSYEKTVVAAEKAAKSNNMSSLLKLQEEALKLTEEVEDFEDSSAWTMKDSEKYLELTNRYTEAMMSLSNSTPSLDFGSFSF